jgi:hypothetical protein
MLDVLIEDARDREQLSPIAPAPPMTIGVSVLCLGRGLLCVSADGHLARVASTNGRCIRR